jgi:predicted SAM-dependent methyltransferase
MATESSMGQWDWEDPDAFARKRAETDIHRSRCEHLERATATKAPFTRGELVDLGVTGIEFGTLSTNHPSGLAADLISLHDDHIRTERDQIFRVAGGRYFTELNIADPLPFEADSVDWVYAEHLIEHVALPVAIGWLKEVKRILVPGGLLRLTTPDLHRYAKCYLHDDGFFAAHSNRMSAVIIEAPPMPRRPAFMLNQIFYLYGHRWIYDLDELRYVLFEAGFPVTMVRVCSFREGNIPEVASLDRFFRNDETIYVEANT